MQKKTKLYGPKNALDYENISSSWNSEGIINSSSSNENEQSQYLVVGFGSHRLASPKLIKIQFQAGFGCEQCHVYVTQKMLTSASPSIDNDISYEWIKICSLELSDVHDLQTHEFHTKEPVQYCTAIKIVFDDFADFYKRIIVYRLEIWGDFLTAINE